MTDKPFLINGFQKPANSSVWEWKGIHGNRRSHQDNQVTEFFQDSKQKLEESVVGPGAGVGIGCGVGLGWGVLGGIGINGGGSSWNELKMVFGFGMGCGIGVGIGYGQGIGGGRSLESMKKQFFKTKRKAKRKTIVIEI